jgi:GAF domain-containing protein
MKAGAGEGLPEAVHRPSRLRALAALEANVETSADALDRIAAMACRLLRTPVVIVNLVGADRQRFVGCGGPDEAAMPAREMPLTHGFCPFALGAETAFAFADAQADPELAANPVVRQLGVMAYVGVPLRAAGGEPVGTLCAIDYAPHPWSDDDIAVLTDLAASAVAELQLLAASRQVARQQSRVAALAELSAALGPAGTPEDVIDQLAPVVDRMDASAVWLLLLDAAGEPLEAAASGADPALIVRHAREPLAQIADGGRPDFLATRGDVRDRLAPLLDIVPGLGSVSLLPLEAGEERLGVLGVAFADERALSADDRGFLSALAGISSLALARP